MRLKEYASKREFEKTPEPKPGLDRKGYRLVFVVHKHAARALHYDLRLELEGVLKSWAVLMKTAWKSLPAYSSTTDPTTGITYTDQYDVFTVGAGYVDLEAALNNTNQTRLETERGLQIDAPHRPTRRERTPFEAVWHIEE